LLSWHSEACSPDKAERKTHAFSTTEASVTQLFNSLGQEPMPARRWWLTPVILLGSQRIRTIAVRGQHGQIVGETLSGKKPS
jgi:hypothetical protein